MFSNVRNKYIIHNNVRNIIYTKPITILKGAELKIINCININGSKKVSLINNMFLVILGR